MKFKHLFFAAALFSIAPLFCACNDDDNEIEVPRDPEEDPSSQPDTTPEATSPTEATGLYVINAGNLSNNVNGTLSFINFEKGTASNNVFFDINKRSLGGTPQDAIVYGSKMYIAIYGSNIIEIVDKNTAKSIKQIVPTSTQGEGPRDIIAANGKVYVSMYDGYVSRIDTLSLTIDATLKTETNYGDYELDLNNEAFAAVIDTNTDKIYGVTVNTTDGTNYGLRHLENIWRGSMLSWGTGYTTEVHGCPVSSAHYKSIMGKTIDSVTYYTDKGMIIFDVPDVKVQTTTGIKATVADIMNTDSSAAVTFDQALPADFKAQYTVDKTVVSCTDGKLAVGALALGTHKVEIADASGKYAAIVTEFTVNTDKMPASYDSNETKLVAAKGITAEEFSAYIKSISKVKVDDTEYAATGRGSKVIVKEDGTLDLTDLQVTDATVFEITAVGYKNNLTFTYKEAENTFELNTSSKTLYTKGSTKTTLKVTTNLTDKITWKSSNTKVAAVNSKGVVTAKAKGTAVITASCGEYKVTCKITVKNPSLKLTKSSATVKVGKTTKISAKATPSGKVTYKSSNTKIATVSSKGVVKGKKKGTAKITVTCNGVKKVFTVKVK